MQRREFLLTASSLAAARALSALDGRSLTSLALAEETKEKASDGSVTFGFSLYGMRALPLAEGLSYCAKLGFDAVELVANEGWPCDPGTLNAERRREIRGQLAENALLLTAIMENLNSLAEGEAARKAADRLKAAAELGRELFPEAAPIVETILGGKPEQWESVKDRMARTLEEWARIGEATRTVIAVKPHVAGALHRPDDARWLVERVSSPWLKLTYDFSHYRLRGLALERSLEQLLPHTAFIHVKDARGAADKFQFLLPGAGDIDYARYFEQLKRDRYTGSIVVEVSGQLSSQPGYDPKAAAKTSYDNLAPLFAKAGLKRRHA